MPRRDGARHTLRADPCKTEKQYLDRKFMKSAFYSILELSNNQQLDIQFSSVQLSLFGHITYYIEQNENKKKKLTHGKGTYKNPRGLWDLDPLVQEKIRNIKSLHGVTAVVYCITKRPLEIRRFPYFTQVVNGG